MFALKLCQRAKLFYPLQNTVNWLHRGNCVNDITLFQNQKWTRYSLHKYCLSQLLTMPRANHMRCLADQSAKNDRLKTRKNEFVKRKQQQLELTKEQLKETKVMMKEKFVEMRENIFTIPNGLCVLRIAATPVLAYFVLNAYYNEALCLFAIAGTTDLVRRFKTI